jgi:hypothetical protein
MLPFIEELDSLLLNYNPANRIDILSNVILSSLTSSNPISSLKDYINFFKIVIGIEKASTIISQSQKISKEQAKIALRSFISSAPYSKNKFKQNPYI